MSQSQNEENEIRSLLNEFEEVNCLTENEKFKNRILFYNRLSTNESYLDINNARAYDIFKQSLDKSERNHVNFYDWMKALSESPDINFYPSQVSGFKQLLMRVNINTCLFVKILEVIHKMKGKQFSFFELEDIIYNIKIKLRSINKLKLRVLFKIEKLASYLNRSNEDFPTIFLLQNKLMNMGENLSKDYIVKKVENLLGKAYTIKINKQEKLNLRKNYKLKISELNQSLEATYGLMAQDFSYLSFISQEIKSLENGSSNLCDIHNFSDINLHNEEENKENIGEDIERSFEILLHNNENKENQGDINTRILKSSVSDGSSFNNLEKYISGDEEK